MSTPRRSEEGEVVCLRFSVKDDQIHVELETPAGGDTELATIGTVLLEGFILGYGTKVNSLVSTDRDGNVVSAYDANAEVN